MISPSFISVGVGAVAGGLTACAACSCTVCAAAGAAIASTDVPINNAVEMRMRPSPFWSFCCVADTMPESTLLEDERDARRVTFQPTLLHYFYSPRSALRRTAGGLGGVAMACAHRVRRGRRGS